METHEELRELSFSVSGIIAKSIRQVFEAVADPEQLSHYFTTGGAEGYLENGATVTWDFHDFPGAFPVKVVEVEEPKRIVIQWVGQQSTAEDGMNTVRFDFESLEDSTRTKVTISEASWVATADGAKAAFGNCEGWTGMLAAMKAWLEYGINLREGFYK
ncbi:SRPBCC domain-containing protein [Glutamicibacter sp. FR1]|uniref:SRPBCC domain-containing protein n=1 Tax=Glutamicibacter sp. FR1 TaxID=3393744 RepID=UPI0039AF80D5